MERLEGVDLRRKLKNSAGGLPVPVALNYALQICEGIAEAHAHGIIHRDLKPANLFVTRKEDGTDLIKIMDFGISKWNGGEIGEITKDGTLLGSPKYMAPEQVFGAKSIDTRADIWSIGAIVYEMLAGRTPYVETTLARLCGALVAGPPPRLDEVNPDLPARLASVVARSLESTPAARTASVAELAGALLDAVDESGQGVRERLEAILAMRRVDDVVPSAGNLMANLRAGSIAPVSGRTPPSQILSEIIPRPGSEPPAATGETSRPPTTQTLPSPISMGRAAANEKAPAATPAQPAPQRSPRLYIAIGAAIAAAVGAFVAMQVMSSPKQAGKATQPTAVAEAPTVAQTAPSVLPTGAATPTQPSVVPAEPVATRPPRRPQRSREAGSPVRSRRRTEPRRRGAPGDARDQERRR